MTAKQKKQGKELLGKLHDKYYGKKKAKAPKPNPETKAPEQAAPAAAETLSKEPTRHELMLKAKERGIKNFRVINKQELVEILKEGTTQERINEIVAGAVARWKAGWGKKKNKKEVV
jgi:hypothetical protein